MTFPGLRVHRPETIAEAVDLQHRLGDGAALLAGGTELLLLMRLGLTGFEHLISIGRLPGMDELFVAEAGDLFIGGGATHQQVADSDVVRQLNGVLSRSEGRLANLRVRLAGTLAGNLAFADPHSDTLTLLSALNAWLECEAPTTRRKVPVADLMVGPFTTVLEPAEVITRIVVPARWLRSPLAHERFESRRQRPMVTVSCAAQADADGRFEDLRLVVGSVCPKPVVVGGLSRWTGSRPEEFDTATVAAVGATAMSQVPLRDDEYGSADYKSNLISVLVNRAVRAMLASSAASRNDSRIP